MNFKLHILGLCLAGLATTSAARASDRPDFATDFGRFAEAAFASEWAPPGAAVVVVDDKKIIYAHAFGVRSLDDKTPLTLDDPIYIASTTKAYVGLLAARLDEAGMLPLEATFADVWPDLILPKPMQAKDVTATKLLSHTSGVESPVLSWLYSDIGAYRARDVPKVLSQYAVPANRAFDYGNIGPVMYTAMAEAKTGKDWRDLVDEYVFKPLDLSHTAARLESVDPRSIGQCHAWHKKGWEVAPPKATALMNAGGGMFTSGHDAAKFLLAYTSDGASTNGAITRQALQRSYAKAADQDRDGFGFRRDGYSLGFDLSEYNGERVVSRSGGNPGCRSIAAFLPGQGFGIAVLTLGDAGGNAFNAALVMHAVNLWTGHTDSTPGAALLRKMEEDAKQGRSILESIPRAPASRKLPDAAQYTGTYSAPGFGDIELVNDDGALEIRAVHLRMLIAREATGGFKAYPTSLESPVDMTFERATDGAVSALTLWGVRFARKL